MNDQPEILDVTCTLASGSDIIFEIENPEHGDYDETWQLFQLFAGTVGA